MATKNGADWIGDQLVALAQQDPGVPWELVVADNGSADGTMSVLEEHRHRFAQVVVVDASQRAGKQHAQRMGVAAATGDLLAFADQDDVCSSEWLAALTRAAANFDAVGGRMDSETLNTVVDRTARPYADTGSRGLPEALNAGPYAPGGNLGIWREVWDTLDDPVNDLPFRASAGEDCDLGFRLRQKGFTLGFAPDAVVAYRLRPAGRALRRQMRWYGVADAALVKRYGALGAHGDGVIDGVRKFAFLVPRAAKATIERDSTHWSHAELAVALGRLEGSLRYRVVCL